MSCLMPYYNRVYGGETEPPQLPATFSFPPPQPSSFPPFSLAVNISSPHVAALSLNKVPFVKKETVTLANPPFFHSI
jgi:hypothetical protein